MYCYITIVTFNDYSEFCRAESILSGIEVNYLPCTDDKIYHLLLPDWFADNNAFEHKLFFGRLDADEINYLISKSSFPLPVF